MSKYKALGTRVLVEVNANPDTTAGGIVIPQTALGNYLTVKIIDKGSKARDDIEVGSLALISAQQGARDLSEDGKQLRLMEEDQILMLVKE